MELKKLKTALKQKLGSDLFSAHLEHNELTIVVDSDKIKKVALKLRDDFKFEQLTDLIGIDYATYGHAEWKTDSATTSGFSRGADRQLVMQPPRGKRFAVIYQLLSISQNIRLRVKAFLDGQYPKLDSVIEVWSVADWYEREAFDLFGILFDGHPDLRRILTDYGFIGHPFRKDFPLIGYVEMRYDANQKRVVYGPVEIQPRTLVARVIRDDSRYLEEKV